MGLYVKGMCLSSRSRQVRSKKGIDYTFHRACIHDPDGNSDPVYVETGEVELSKGHYYRIAVWVNTYTTQGGEPRSQLNTFKDSPPVKINPPVAKGAAA